MPRIEIKDLNEEITISEEEIKHVKGGLLHSFSFAANKSSPDLMATNFPKVEMTFDRSANKFLK